MRGSTHEAFEGEVTLLAWPAIRGDYLVELLLRVLAVLIDVVVNRRVVDIEPARDEYLRLIG